MDEHDKSHRRDAAQYFTAAELCRRGIVAVITLGNCPNTDILCSNKEGNLFVHIQVKTFVPGNKTCSVGQKAEHDYGDNFFWVLAGIMEPDQEGSDVYYIIPSKEMAKYVKAAHSKWENTPGKKGQKHNETTMRTIALPPFVDKYSNWDISIYKNRWDLIEEKLNIKR